MHPTYSGPDDGRAGLGEPEDGVLGLARQLISDVRIVIGGCNRRSGKSKSLAAGMRIALLAVCPASGSAPSSQDSVVPKIRMSRQDWTVYDRLSCASRGRSISKTGRLCRFVVLCAWRVEDRER